MSEETTLGTKISNDGKWDLDIFNTTRKITQIY